MKSRIPVGIIFALTVVINAFGLDSPRLIPFQSRLTDQSGIAVSNGIRLIQFKIYDVPTGGNPIWAGELHRTTVNGGLVNVLLGTKTPFTGIDFDRQLYLEITVDINGDNAITAADPPMLPRQVILPVVFSKESADSRLLGGYNWSALLGTNDPINGKLNGSRIQTNSITANQIAAGAIIPTNLSAAVQEFLVPRGGIIMWSGSVPPSGWAICDGQNGTPDLRDRFIVASGPTYPRGTTGGLPTHDHGGTTGNHTLIEAEIPSHRHASWGEAFADEAPWGVSGGAGHLGAGNSDRDNYFFNTSPVGGDQPHNHPITASSNIPPYYSLAFIIKL